MEFGVIVTEALKPAVHREWFLIFNLERNGRGAQKHMQRLPGILSVLG